MISLRIVPPSSLAVALLFSSVAMLAQSPADIRQKLESQYVLTKATADQSDIVTAGAVLVLQKDDLLMSASTQTAAQNTYKDGKISQGIWKVARIPGFGGMSGHLGTSISTRTFVTGEKFWVTKIEVHDDGIVFNLLSDPIQDVRYHATLKFASTKGATPSADQVLSQVGEVLKAQPAEDAGAGGSGGNTDQPPAATVNAAAQSAPPPMAAIAPPPPPADTPPPAPKTIALKQTKEQVTATFGPPTKVVKLGAKEIDYYPDMKVTFVNDKVTDVQ